MMYGKVLKPSGNFMENVRALWIKACEFDNIPTNSKFVVSSAANPYVAQYQKAMSLLLASKR